MKTGTPRRRKPRANARPAASSALSPPSQQGAGCVPEKDRPSKQTPEKPKIRVKASRKSSFKNRDARPPTRVSMHAPADESGNVALHLEAEEALRRGAEGGIVVDGHPARRRRRVFVHGGRSGPCVRSIGQRGDVGPRGEIGGRLHHELRASRAETREGNPARGRRHGREGRVDGGPGVAPIAYLSSTGAPSEPGIAPSATFTSSPDAIFHCW